MAAAVNRRVVVVTGCPRSGTTPVGAALARSRGARELYEPLNMNAGDRRIEHYYEMPGTPGWDLAADPAAVVDDVVALRLHLRPGTFATDTGARALVKRVTGGRTANTYRLARLTRPPTLVWKDPFAVFWLPLIAERQPSAGLVVTHRPVGAVAGSFVRLNWKLSVPKIGERYRRAYGEWPAEARELERRFDLTVPQYNAAFFWVLLYSWLLDHAPARTVFLDLETFEVEASAAALRQHLGLRPAARTPGPSPAAPGSGPDFGKRAHTRHRDLSRVNSYWRDLVAAADAEVITGVTAELAARLRQRSWEPPA